MKTTLISAIALLLAINFATAEEPTKENPAEVTSNKNVEPAKLLKDLKFINIGDAKPADFIRTHPCMTGSWEAVRETDTHWIGRLYYPSDNISKETNYMTADFKIKKDDQTKIDLSKWKGRLILLMPKSNSREEEHIRNEEFIVIGFGENGKFLNDGIIELQKIAPYKPE